MNKLKNGGPAFPQDIVDMYGTREVHGGMTLRDYFAAKAMPAAVTALNSGGMLDVSYERAELIAQYAYRLADAMLTARA